LLLKQVKYWTLKIRYMPVFCLFTLGRHGHFTAEHNGTAIFVVYCTCAKYRVVEYYRVYRFIDVILELYFSYTKHILYTMDWSTPIFLIFVGMISAILMNQYTNNTNRKWFLSFNIEWTIGANDRK
jgi:hypothetical protein